MELKINKIVYEITKADRFLDDGSTTQLLTQSKEPKQGGRRPNPMLNGWARKRLYKADIIESPSTQYRGTEIRLA